MQPLEVLVAEEPEEERERLVRLVERALEGRARVRTAAGGAAERSASRAGGGAREGAPDCVLLGPGLCGGDPTELLAALAGLGLLRPPAVVALPRTGLDLVALRAAVEDAIAAGAPAPERARGEHELLPSRLFHDLEAPLRATKRFAELLVQEYAGRLDDQADRWIGHILGGCARQTALLGAMRDYVRAGRAVDAGGRADLSCALATALAGLRELVERTGAEVRASDLPALSGSQDAWNAVLRHLVENALVHAGGQAPRIDVAMEGAATLVVRDHGPGVEERFLEAAFEPLRRLTASQRAGLGLATCRRLVEAHGGRVHLERADGGGLRAVVDLPPGRLFGAPPRPPSEQRA